MDNVYLKCIKESGKLRVKIISPGYNQNANCQFPRDMRVENRVFCVPANNISVANTLEIGKLVVNEIYFKNSQWRVRVYQPSDLLYFEYFNRKTKQWEVQHRIIH